MNQDVKRWVWRGGLGGLAVGLLVVTGLVIEQPTRIEFGETCVPSGVISSLRAKVRGPRFWQLQLVMIDSTLKVVRARLDSIAAEEKKSEKVVRPRSDLDALQTINPRAYLDRLEVGRLVACRYWIAQWARGSVTNLP